MFVSNVYAEEIIPVKICHGEYALCAASGAYPTGKDIVVQGTTYKEGISVCPVLNGAAIANMKLMDNSCKSPKGKVWSLFSTETSYPQAPTWAVTTAVVRKFVTTSEIGGGMSNMWAFECTKRAKKVNGVTLADCLGPLNESPWDNGAVPVGTNAFTAAPLGSPNPVGGVYQ